MPGAQCKVADLKGKRKVEAKDRYIPILKVHESRFSNRDFFCDAEIAVNFALLRDLCVHMEYYKIGKLVAVHGLKGELLLKHELGKKTSLKGLAAIFIEDKKNSFLPWFIESTRIKTEEEIYIKLEGLNSREDAIRLVQKETWLPETDFKKFAAKSSPVSLLGYTIINNNESLGEILEVIEQPHQVLCRLEIQSKEVLIPLHEQFLQKVDHKKKEVIVQLPEGLLDIYLG